MVMDPFDLPQRMNTSKHLVDVYSESLNDHMYWVQILNFARGKFGDNYCLHAGYDSDGNGSISMISYLEAVISQHMNTFRMD